MLPLVLVSQLCSLGILNGHKIACDVLLHPNSIQDVTWRPSWVDCLAFNGCVGWLVASQSLDDINIINSVQWQLSFFFIKRLLFGLEMLGAPLLNCVNEGVADLFWQNSHFSYMGWDLVTGIIPPPPLQVFIKDNASKTRQVFSAGEKEKHRAEHTLSSADTFITAAHLECFHSWQCIGCMQTLLLAGSLTFLCLFFLSIAFSFCLSFSLLSAPFNPYSHTLSISHEQAHTHTLGRIWIHIRMQLLTQARTACTVHRVYKPCCTA